MIVLIVAHLWQSTAILGVAAVLTQLLRKHSAGSRYWLWFAASAKFLVPVSLLAGLSSRWLPETLAPMLPARASQITQRLAEPFVARPPASSVTAAVPGSHLSTILLIIWSAGCGAVLASWFLRWRRTRRVLSSAKPLSIPAPIAVCESHAVAEPGLVGIFRPVIILPAGLAARLAPAEMRGVLAHELCHYRRHDNLTAAVHMLVEALFWSFPPIWWLGARLIAERERACDESVLAAGIDARIYAHSILKVCRFSKQPSIACAAGACGGPLSLRMEAIMNSQRALPLGPARRLFITSAMAVALLAMGVSALASASGAPTPAQRDRLLVQQLQDQNDGVFVPRDFDRFAGYYQHVTSGLYARVYRTGDHYYAQLTGKPPAEFYPQAPNNFFAPRASIDIKFVSAPNGEISGMFLRQGGSSQPWLRISKSTYDAATADLHRRIKANTPSPGTEASLLRWIHAWEQQARPNYGDMEPAAAETAREQAPLTADLFQQLGSLKSLAFLRVDPVGMDVYLGTFDHGQALFNIGPLDSNGKVVSRTWDVLP